MTCRKDLVQTALNLTQFLNRLVVLKLCISNQEFAAFGQKKSNKAMKLCYK